MKRLCRTQIAITLSCLSLFLCREAVAEDRVWTSTKGATLTAEFVNVTGDQVLLQKPDGDKVIISEYALSQADRTYVAAQTGELSLPGKKGICFTLRETGKPGSAMKNIPKIKELNVYWNYSWGSSISDKQPPDIEFVPMIWGGSICPHDLGW